MIIRALDNNHDWTFGAGINNYRTDLSALAEDIKTRLLCFLGDCYFDLASGIDWISYLGSRNRQEELQLEVASVILSTENVLSIENLDMDLSSDRKIYLNYTINTSFGSLENEVQYSI